MLLNSFKKVELQIEMNYFKMNVRIKKFSFQLKISVRILNLYQNSELSRCFTYVRMLA